MWKINLSWEDYRQKEEKKIWQELGMNGQSELMGFTRMQSLKSEAEASSEVIPAHLNPPKNFQTCP